MHTNTRVHAYEATVLTFLHEVRVTKLHLRGNLKYKYTTRRVYTK